MARDAESQPTCRRKPECILPVTVIQVIFLDSYPAAKLAQEPCISWPLDTPQQLLLVQLTVEQEDPKANLHLLPQILRPPQQM
ncbi:hypothetical protein AV530_014474 [Patagioenas fasciata monilis]|uniref:Uncharacterized protein n=1 Tax=Patagioenas fasciata monilis TaxID=372326 RepID=A0A1V4KBW2_PATFA|nr:hypothetical protein AV530_014474 [Patagioenas fasciata monilis]